MWRTPPWVIVLRDLASLAIGVWGVIHEELSGKADLGRLGFFAVLMVAPGVLAGVWLALQQSGTDGPGQSSASPPAPSASPSPSGQ